MSQTYLKWKDAYSTFWSISMIIQVPHKFLIKFGYSAIDNVLIWMILNGPSCGQITLICSIHRPLGYSKDHLLLRNTTPFGWSWFCTLSKSCLGLRPVFGLQSELQSQPQFKFLNFTSRKFVSHIWFEVDVWNLCACVCQQFQAIAFEWLGLCDKAALKFPLGASPEVWLCWSNSCLLHFIHVDLVFAMFPSWK